jgi:peptidyl-prolyl cis-trans isomerase D
MLDRMRRHRNWLNWSLVLVCLAFIVFYIPDFLRGTSGPEASGDTIAVVEGHEIKADEFRRTYQAQLQAYRSAYGGNMSEQLLKQLGVEQQILQQMVDERASLAEAERLGIKVSDEELRQRIFEIPAFQENGQFIGQQRYQQLLASQRPPLSPGEFEDNVRRSLVVEKLRTALTDWLSVSDKELEQEYRRRNDKVKLDVVAIGADSVRGQVSASDAEVASYFGSHQEDFRVPEKRKIKYVLIDLDALRAKINIPPADVERAYNEGIAQYSTPEQVRASHILLKTDGKNDDAVKAKAEDVLKQAKAPGADFAALAKKYSEDEGTAANGGDLNFFGRGRMVPEFDAAAFAMEPGQISDLVKTQYGYHIIKLIEKKPATTKPLDEVKQQITDQLANERAQTQATDLADSMSKQIKSPADLDPVAKANGLQVQETGFFSRDEPVLGLGASPEAAAEAFALGDGQVSQPVRTAKGFVFETVTGKQASYLPKLDDVKEKVREAVITSKARDVAKQKATELAAKLKSASDFDKAAKAAGYDAKTTDMLTRDGQIPDLGSAPAVLEAAFKLEKGAVSDPIPTDSGTAIVKVLDKSEALQAEIDHAKDSFRQELLQDRRGRFFASYMTKAKQKMKIDVNREAVQRVIG